MSYKTLRYHSISEVASLERSFFNLENARSVKKELICQKPHLIILHNCARNVHQLKKQYVKEVLKFIPNQATGEGQILAIILQSVVILKHALEGMEKRTILLAHALKVIKEYYVQIVLWDTLEQVVIISALSAQAKVRMQLNCF